MWEKERARTSLLQRAGRVWAGHNINAFDNVRIREAFLGQGLRPPEPKGCVDTLQLLRRSFGTRAGDMKVGRIRTLQKCTSEDSTSDRIALS